MHKKIVALLVGVGLLIAILLSIFIQQKNTYAWSDNDDYLDSDFWLNDRTGTTGEIIDAVFGSIGDTDTFYTNYWTSNSCDPSLIAVEYVPLGTDTIPFSLDANKIYVLEVGIYNTTAPIVFSGNCTAVVAKIYGNTSSDLSYVVMTGGTDTFVMSGKSNNVIAGFYVDTTATRGIYVANTDNSTFWPANVRYSANAMVFETVSQLFIGGSISNAGTGLYLNNGQNIKYGTTWPIALSRFGGTGLYIINTNNMTLDVDVTHNTSMGGYFQNTNDITINSRYWTNNGGKGLRMHSGSNISVLGLSFSANAGDGIHMSQINNLTIAGVLANQNTGHGIWIQDSLYVTGSNITATNAAGSNIGLYVSNTDDVYITNVTATGNGAYGIGLTQVDNFSIQGAMLSQNNVDGANINNGNMGLLDNIIASDNTYGDGITMNWSSDISLQGVQASGNGGDGISLENAQNISTSDIDLYENASDGWYGYGLTDFTVSDYTVYDNDANGVIVTEQSTSGYIYSGVVYNNSGVGVFIEGGSTGINVDTVVSYDNGAGFGIFGSETQYNIIQNAVAYGNSNAGFYLAGTLNNILYNIYAYNNPVYGVMIHNSSYNTVEQAISHSNGIGMEINGDSEYNTIYNMASFSNLQQGIYLNETNNNEFTYIQLYDNDQGIQLNESQGNTINNALVYDHTDAAISLFGKGLRRNTFNNMALFNNVYAIDMYTVSTGDEVVDNVFNNIALLNNTYGLYMEEIYGVNIANNLFNNLYIYHNDRGVYTNGATVAGNQYYGDFIVEGNTLDFQGTNGYDVTLSGGSAIPGLGRSAGSLTTGTPFTMTCNRAIQATSIVPSNLLQYPYCDAKGPQPWTGSIDVRYTYFPEIIKQIQPVAYNGLSLLSSGSYISEMFVGDYVWSGTSPFGGHTILDEQNMFTYLVGPFVYKNHNGVQLQMIANQGTPSYTITGVDDPIFDGVLTPINGLFAGPLNYTLGFSMINQDGLWIVRTSYEDAGSISNYYGFIRGLGIDDDAISIQKQAHTGTVIVGNQIGFSITISNTGSGPAGFSQVIDSIPDGIDTGSLIADPLGSYSGDINAYVWDMAIVSGNTTYTFTITGTVLPDYTGSQIINTAYFISDQTSNGPDWIINDDASVDVLIPENGVCGAVLYHTFYGENMVNQSVPSYLCSSGVLTGFTGPINGVYERYCDGTYGGSQAYCTVQESRCGDGNLDDDPMAFGYGTAAEQCDLGNMNGNGIDGCSATCTTEVYGCTDPMADNYNASANVDDGSCYILGCTNPSARNYDSGADTDDGSCMICGDGQRDLPYEQCDDANLNDNDGCNNQCIIETGSCTLTATPSIGLMPLDVNFTFQGSTGFVFDYINYGTGVTGTNFNYTYFASGLYTVTAYQHDQWSGDVVSSCSAVVRVNQLSCVTLGFSVAPTTGTVPFVVTGSYTSMPTGYTATSLNWGDGNNIANPLLGTDYGHIYSNTGVYTAQLHVQNTSYSGFDLYCPIGIGASACGDTGTIDVDTLEISVVKTVQNNGVSVFPNGLVPYIIEVTNTSTQARLDNVTVVDLISDNMLIGSYFFEYNGTIYSNVVNDGYFVIDNTILPISLDPGESIEIVVYATMDVGQGLQGNNYAFAGGDWIPLNNETFCSSSGTVTPTCNRNPNSPVVQDISGWSSFAALNGSFNPNNFTVCAETDQGAPTAPGSLGTPLDPAVTVQKTLVDGNGNPTSQVTVREDATFVLDIDFTNMYPHTIDWNNFSFTDYFSGGIGISGRHIVDIQTASGVSVPRSTGVNEYNIDLSGLYAPGNYTPACQTFTRNSGDHVPGCWSSMGFGALQSTYSSCIPPSAIISGYQHIQRYTITGAGLDGIQFFPGINDQWFGGSAVWSFFDMQPHTVMLCQEAPIGIVIDQIDSLQLIVTANVTEPTLVDQGTICNEASISYAGTGGVDDACFNLTVPQYCTLMMQPDFVIDTYDTVPYISGGLANGSILSDMTLTSTTTSANPIVDYQWNIYSSGDFLGMWNSPHTFDNSLIVNGQGTPSIDLNFMPYSFDATWPFIRVSLTVTDTMGYQATYETPLFRDHDQGGLYWIAGNVITGSAVTGYDFNMTGEMLSSSTDANIIPTNQLYFPDIGPIANLAGIDRYNIGTNDEFFPYTGPYNYTNTYIPGVHMINLNTHIGDINQNYMIGHRTYPVACSVSCGNGSIEGIEQCDDSNTTDADGCSSSCQIESGRQCVGQPSVCSMNLVCGDGVPQSVSGSTSTGTVDYVIYGDISAITGNEEYGFMGYQTGMIFTFSGDINTGTVVSYQWQLSGSDSMNPGITGFIVGSTTGPSIDIFSNAFGINGTNRQGHITLTMVDTDGNTIQVQGYINAYRDGMTVVYPSVNNISIAGSTVTYSDYELNIAGSSGLFPPLGFVQNASTGWEMLFNNGGWAGYDRYEDGIYDHTQQGTPQVVQYTYNATGEYISTDVTFFYSGFAMNIPAYIGDLHTNYVFHTTAGQTISGYQELCDDGNQDDYDGCTTQCTLTNPQCQMVVVQKLDPIINYNRAYPLWTGDAGIVITFNTPTAADGYTYQWSLSGLDLTAIDSLQFSGSSTDTQTQVYIAAEPIQGSYSFPDFSFQIGLTVSNGLMTGYVDGIVYCTKNGACGFTTYSYNFVTGNVQGFTVNGNYNFVTYMQSINETTPVSSSSLTGVTIQNGGWNYFLGIYDTGTYIRYTSPSNGSGYILDSGSTYDTIPFQLSGGGVSFNNVIGVSYYNTCLGGSYCGDSIVDPNTAEECDLGSTNGQANSGCSNSCQIQPVTCNIIGFPLGGNAPLVVSLAMNPTVLGSYFDYGNGKTGTASVYTYTTGGIFNITGYIPHPTASGTMVACPLVSQITVNGQCSNGALNRPTCNTCGAGQYYCAASQQCIATGGTCAGCTNGATNYPACNTCGTGQIYCGTTQQCIASGSVCGLCTNGATNPPACDLCGLGQSYCAASQQCIPTGGACAGCSNGALNRPTCNTCGAGQYYCAASQQCIATGGTCAGCTNGAINYPSCNQCGVGQFYCSATQSCKNNGQSCGGGGGGGGGILTDYCPAGDFSSSYYDQQCGSAPVHGSAPVGKFCIYNDEEYLARGSFDDIFGHRGELPIEVMRVSCLHRGRHTKVGLRRYEPNANIQRDEVLKTLVKIVGIEFEDFSIKSEELLYTGVIPFVDVAYNNRFSHYAAYAFSKGLTEGLYTADTSQRYLSPTKWMTRYEATKAIVIAYEKIQGPIDTQGARASKITDVPTNDPNYTYVRKAEVAGLVQGYPQTDGTFLFKGNGSITRAEFAKIIAAAFNEQLIDVDEVVVTSSAYNMIIQSIQQVKGDKLTFIRNLFEKLKLIDEDIFLRKFKVQKDVFIKALADKVLLPMVDQ